MKNVNKALIMAVVTLAIAIPSIAMERPEDEQLITAVKHNDYAAAEEALKKNANPNVRIYGKDPIFYQDPILYRAIMTGNPAMVRALIEYGADISLNDPNGQNVLHASVSGGNPEIIGEFINRGANVNAQDRYGDTPLHIAVTGFRTSEGSGSYKKIIRYLLHAGADINIKNKQGKTALDLAGPAA